MQFIRRYSSATFSSYIGSPIDVTDHLRLCKLTDQGTDPAIVCVGKGSVGKGCEMKMLKRGPSYVYINGLGRTRT
jgi:hypothetical protein